MQEKTAAIVLSAGSGKRMGGPVSKQYMLLRGKPVIYYALKAFQDSFVDEIILVVGKGDVDRVRKEIVEQYGFTKVSAIVEGGAQRYHSVHLGLKAVKDADYVFIQDGARPFPDGAMLGRCLEAVRECGACVVGVPVKDTIKVSDAEGNIADTPPRERLWQVQTPQVFDAKLVCRAYDLLAEKEEELLAKGITITDDAMVVEQLTKHTVRLVMGDYKNIKITTPEDLILADAFLL